MQYIKKAVEFLIRFFLGIWFGIPLMFLAFIGMLKGKFMKKAVSFVSCHFALVFAKVFSKFSKYYCLIEFLPKKAEDVTACNLLTDTKENEYAIVLQGPIVDRFTAETVRIYRKIFPKAVIIVSTWKGTDEKLAEELRELADHLILSEPPQTSGIGNINYQAKSSYEGMKRACELGISYAMKTRTDNRIYTTMLFEYMKTLIEVFPLDNIYSKWQKERIFTFSGGGISNPYWLCDLFFFGTSQDMLNFFDMPPNPVNYKGMDTFALRKYITSFGKWIGSDGRTIIGYAPEILLCKSYIKRFGSNNYDTTLKSFWDKIRGRFFILSRADLRIYWNKYDTEVNFWNHSGGIQPKDDTDRFFTTALSSSLIKGHLLYDTKLEGIFKDRIEPFPSLGTFCSNYQCIDEIFKDIPFLRGDDQN